MSDPCPTVWITAEGGVVLDEMAELGREVVLNGRLGHLRLDLGLSRSAMAELLSTSNSVYTTWESNPPHRMWGSTAARIGRFYVNATRQLDDLRDHQIPIDELMPLFAAASALGVAQELLLKCYREDKFHAEDLGILGLWVYRDDLQAIGRML